MTRHRSWTLRQLLPLSMVAVAGLTTSTGHAQGTDQRFNQPPPPPPPAPAPAPRLTRPPGLIKPPQPRYPPEALAAKLSADVTMQIDIDVDGHVVGVSVVAPAGHGFDEAAATAAAEMEFTPAEVDGKPARIRIEYVLHFRP